MDINGDFLVVCWIRGTEDGRLPFARSVGDAKKRVERYGDHGADLVRIGYMEQN
jgi:hypothetical protein